MFNTEIQNGLKKWQENDILEIASRLCRYPAGQTFRRNRSISLRFQDKRVFVFDAEIQDGRQKWRENDFCKKLPVDSAASLRVKNYVKMALAPFPR